MQDGFQLHVLLHQVGGGPGTHAHASQWAIGEIQDVCPSLFEHTRTLQQALGANPLGGMHLHGNDEHTVSEVLRQLGRLVDNSRDGGIPLDQLDPRQGDEMLTVTGRVQGLTNGRNVGIAGAATPPN